MRNCLVISVWLFLLLFLFGTGSCALCAVVYLPYQARMMGCLDCEVLEVGDPDAIEWRTLEDGRKYVLVGCPAEKTHEAVGHEWFIIGNAKKHASRAPHEVAFRVDPNQIYGRSEHHYRFFEEDECLRMLVRYEGGRGQTVAWEPFVGAID